MPTLVAVRALIVKGVQRSRGTKTIGWSPQSKATATKATATASAQFTSQSRLVAEAWMSWSIQVQEDGLQEGDE